MNSVTNKTRLAEKRYRDKIKENKKEIRLDTKKQNKRKLEKLKKTITIIIIKCKKEKKITKLQKKKQYDLNNRRTLIRKQNESDKETKQNERGQKNIVEDIDLGRFFELATSNKI